MSPRRSRTAANHLMGAVTVADNERYPSAGAGSRRPARRAAFP
jgi:hypothetical protein